MIDPLLRKTRTALGGTRSRRKNVVVAASSALVWVALLGLAAGTAAAPLDAPQARRYLPGAPSLGDPLAPGLGNGGYHVSHYRIHVTYRPATGRLSGSATITARATQNLSKFDLDFALAASSVRVNAQRATYKSKSGPIGDKLVVTPRHGIRKGKRLIVTVRYSGHPASVKINGFSGWQHTPTGIISWEQEPPSPAEEWWYPGNDHPSDQASYDVVVKAPRTDTVLSNGSLRSRTVRGHMSTSHWHSAAPMPSYTSLLAIGHYRVSTRRSLDHVPTIFAYERGGGALMHRARTDIQQTPEVLRFLQHQLGRYPFAAAGGLVDRQDGGWYLPDATRATYQLGIWTDPPALPFLTTAMNASQWYGVSVSPKRWKDAWLMQGMQEFMEWRRSEAIGQGTSQALFRSAYAENANNSPVWRTSPVHPPWALDFWIQPRAAMMLQALHNRVGETTFSRILRGYAATYLHRAASTQDFITYTTRISGQDLHSFFHSWLYARTKPAPTRRNGFSR
jgi:aminopeptidase N